MRKLIKLILILYFSSGFLTAESKQNHPSDSQLSPYLVILGVTQDAGYPQAGCYKAHCMGGWKNPKKKKQVVSLGIVDPLLKTHYLFEATPNFPNQLYQLENIYSSHDSILDGIFLTHAHIGHYTGLMYLGHEAMATKNTPVYAMPKMKKFLENNGPWSQLVDYKNIVIKSLNKNKRINVGRLRITPFLVPHRDEYSETVGFRIEGPNKSALFIPDINKWNLWKENLPMLIKTVDYAFLDSTFFTQGELPGRDMSKVPHPLVTETMKALKSLSTNERNKVWLIHFNHTNPLLVKGSPAQLKVKQFGFNIAEEGVKLAF